MTGTISPLGAGLMGVWLSASTKGDALRLPPAPSPAEAATVAGWRVFWQCADVCLALTDLDEVVVVAMSAGGYPSAAYLTDGGIDPFYARTCRS